MNNEYTQELINNLGLKHISVQSLEEIYKELEQLLTNSFYDTEETAPKTLKEITMLEYKLQDVLRCKLDKTKHTYHLHLPRCSCPKKMFEANHNKECIYYTNTKDNNEITTNLANSE